MKRNIYKGIWATQKEKKNLYELNIKSRNVSRIKEELLTYQEITLLNRVVIIIRNVVSMNRVKLIG